MLRSIDLTCEIRLSSEIRLSTTFFDLTSEIRLRIWSLARRVHAREHLSAWVIRRSVPMRKYQWQLCAVVELPIFSPAGEVKRLAIKYDYEWEQSSTTTVDVLDDTGLITSAERRDGAFASGFGPVSNAHQGHQVSYNTIKYDWTARLSQRT